MGYSVSDSVSVKRRHSPEYIAHFCGFDLIDYRRPGDGVLISSGCGLMMAAMDMVPRLRWCIDIDACRPLWSRVPQFMSALDRNCELALICITGAFMSDKPDALREGASRVKNAACVVYCSRQGHFTDEAMSLDEFALRAQRAPRIADQKKPGNARALPG